MTTTRRPTGRSTHWAPTDRSEAIELVALLDRSVEELGEALAGHEPTSAGAQRLRRLQAELASHALAARVLVTSGASSASVGPVLLRAATLLEEERWR